MERMWPLMLGTATTGHVLVPPPRPCRDTEQERVRQQAAEIVAALGPAALEIIAEFRAERWASTAARKDDPEGYGPARKRSAEWQRIAASVSMLILDRHDE